MIHAYRLLGYNIIVDAGSGSIHSVDDIAYDAICLFENEGREATAKYIGEKYVELDDEEIAELIEDIEELKIRGKLFSDDFISIVCETERKPVIKALCMNVSHACNMTCSYCFAGNGGYGGGEALMSIETGKSVIDFLLENSAGLKNLDVDFFGGEPLLNWNVVKCVVNYARGKERESGKNFRFTLTSNGLLIDDDVIEFTTREMYNVVLSLDGRKEVNDSARKLPDGSGSYERVLPNIKKLVEARGGNGYYIRGTYTRGNLDFTNDILHLADLGFTELSLEPAVAKPGAPNALSQSDLQNLFEQYERLTEEMLRRKKEAGGFTFYHFKLDLVGGPCLYKRVRGCGVGTEYLAVTPNGELYPCHQFVGDEEFLMGDIWHGITNNTLRDDFGECGIISRNKCRECWARLFCSGGCAANAWRNTGSIAGIYELGCELFKKRLECAIMLKVAGH